MTTDWRIECKHCGKLFETHAFLRQHHKAKHPALPLPRAPQRDTDDHELEADRIIDRMLFGRWS